MKFFVLSILTIVALGGFQQNIAQKAPSKTSPEVLVKQESRVKEEPVKEESVKEEFDLSNVTIEMKRDGSSLGCINCADIYKVSINGAGVLNFEGNLGSKLNGKYTFSVDTEVVRSLLADFQKVDFFSLQDSYTQKLTKDGMTMTVSHAMKTTTTLSWNGKTKSVFNFYGAPDELYLLQNKIDNVVQNIIR